MNSTTITYDDIEFEVEFSYNVIDYTEGNSIEIELFKVTLPDSPDDDLTPLLRNDVLDAIEEKIIEKKNNCNNMDIF